MQVCSGNQEENAQTEDLSSFTGERGPMGKPGMSHKACEKATCENAPKPRGTVAEGHHPSGAGQLVANRYTGLH